MDESVLDDHEEDAQDDVGGGEPRGDGERHESNEKRLNKKQDTGKGKKKRGENKNKEPRLGPATLKTGLLWDKDEHQRFVQVRLAQHG